MINTIQHYIHMHSTPSYDTYGVLQGVKTIFLKTNYTYISKSLNIYINERKKKN